MKKRQVVIIGAGASGLMAAIMAEKKSVRQEMVNVIFQIL